MTTRFGEYLGVFKNGLKNFSNVIDGNLNYYKEQFNLLPADKVAEAERRYNICNDCPFNSKNAVKIGFYETFRTNEHCSLCKCPIEKKVMSFSEECGLSYIKETKDVNNNIVSGLEGFKPLWLAYE